MPPAVQLQCSFHQTPIRPWEGPNRVFDGIGLRGRGFWLHSKGLRLQPVYLRIRYNLEAGQLKFCAGL